MIAVTSDRVAKKIKVFFAPCASPPLLGLTMYIIDDEEAAQIPELGLDGIIYGDERTVTKVFMQRRERI